jgi:hypothetical protein
VRARPIRGAHPAQVARDLESQVLEGRGHQLPVGEAVATAASWRTEDFDIPAYLQRIGIEPGPASLELLEAVHQAHRA